MNLEALLRQVDAGTAQAFVAAARHVIDALLIEGQRWAEKPAPPVRDYEAAELPRGAPPAGWLSHEELRDAAKRLAEALALEKWTDGLICAVKLFAAMGGVL